MDVKWGFIDPGSIMKIDYAAVAHTYVGNFVAMKVFDMINGPKGPSNGYPLPKGKDLIVIGGRKSMAEALTKYGPSAWRSKSTLHARGVYLKSGSPFKDNLTVLIVTAEPEHTLSKYSGMKKGPLCEGKLSQQGDYDSLMRAQDLSFFVSSL